MIWTNQLKERVKTLYLDGLPAREIAAKVGGGVTRNAIIGALHRMGVMRPPQPPREKTEKQRTPRRFKPVAMVMPPPPPPTIANPQPLMTRTGCCYPVGSRDGEYLFCNASADRYCAQHRAVMFHTPKTTASQLERLSVRA